jgi:hypothetical protein
MRAHVLPWLLTEIWQLNVSSESVNSIARSLGLPLYKIGVFMFPMRRFQFRVVVAGLFALTGIGASHAMDVSYSLSGPTTSRPALVFNDGAQTYVQPKQGQIVSVEGSAVRQGPYWVIQGVPNSLKLTIDGDVVNVARLVKAAAPTADLVAIASPATPPRSLPSPKVVETGGVDKPIITSVMSKPIAGAQPTSPLVVDKQDQAAGQSVKPVAVAPIASKPIVAESAKLGVVDADKSPIFDTNGRVTIPIGTPIPAASATPAVVLPATTPVQRVVVEPSGSSPASMSSKPMSTTPPVAAASSSLAISTASPELLIKFVKGDDVKSVVKRFVESHGYKLLWFSGFRQCSLL